MENAVKALLIAGGIFFAILILSLIVYMSTATTRMAEAQEQKKVIEELESFNKNYEAYNKKRMYGADIITVVNKAIDYNRSLGPTEANKAMNIKISVNESFTSTEQTIIEYSNGEIDKKEPVQKNSDYSLIVKNGRIN